MANFNRLTTLVYNTLEEFPETRADDYLLVLRIYNFYVDPETSIKTALKYHAELGLPSFESITRTRRKIQERHPDLVNKPAAEMREREEKEYREYARN